MHATTHRIRRLRWCAKTRSSVEAFALRRHFRDGLSTVLLPALERAFDDASIGEHVLRIPKLEIHLQVASAEDPLDTLSEAVLAEVHAHLRSAVQRGARGERGPTSAHIDARQERFQRLLHYLQTGALPWTSAGSDAAVVVEELCAMATQEISRLAVEAQVVVEADGLRAAFYYRLLQLLPEDRWSLLAEHVAGAPTHHHGRAFCAAFSDIAAERRTSGRRHVCLERAAALLTAGPRVTRAAAHLNTNKVVSTAEVAGAAVNELGVATVAKLRDPLSQARSGPGPAERPVTFSPRRPPDAPLGSREWVPPTKGDASPETRAQAPRFERRGRSLPEAFAVPVNHAGLVLLHPYLPRLFEGTGVREPRSSAIAEEQLPRAAALLHMLATGREEPYEFELTLIKILLGIAPSTALPVSSGLLEPGDVTEADRLLGAVVLHWSALKSTSAAGFRRSFLERPGLLKEEGQSFRLQIEPQPHDLLLARLPWGIGTVKLPWMKKPIFTDWPTP